MLDSPERVRHYLYKEELNPPSRLSFLGKLFASKSETKPEDEWVPSDFGEDFDTE